MAGNHVAVIRARYLLSLLEKPIKVTVPVLRMKKRCPVYLLPKIVKPLPDGASEASHPWNTHECVVKRFPEINFSRGTPAK